MRAAAGASRDLIERDQPRGGAEPGVLAFGVRTNAEMTPAATRATCALDGEAEAALARLQQVRRGMTARTIERLIKVGRTIADLAGKDAVDAESLREAAAYRALDQEPVDDPRMLDGTPGAAG